MKMGRWYRSSEPEKNPEGIKEIQEGILTFAQDYVNHFGPAYDPDQEWLFNISGRDAYAPMLLAASYDERYLKAIYMILSWKWECDIGP